MMNQLFKRSSKQDNLNNESTHSPKEFRSTLEHAYKSLSRHPWGRNL